MKHHEPAFPSSGQIFGHKGMTIRQFYALTIYAGLQGSKVHMNSENEIMELAYAKADKLINYDNEINAVMS